EIPPVVEELKDRYGPLPIPVLSLLEVARFRSLARRGGIAEVVLQGNFVRISPADLPESRQIRLQRLYPKSLLKPGQLLIPTPRTAAIGGRPLRDGDMLSWATGVVEALFL
ncbi:MAG: TRCF domain-containing protein, partial [Streptosporangiaceae bacterium]